MLANLRRLRLPRTLLYLTALLLLGAAGYHWVYPHLFSAYVGTANAPLSFENSRELTAAEFDDLARTLALAGSLPGPGSTLASGHATQSAQTALEEVVTAERRLATPSQLRAAGYPHIGWFRAAGIRRYEGPQTCLQCHPSMRVLHGDGQVSSVATLDNVVDTVHFKFQTNASGFSSFGYDGRQVNAPGKRPIPLGKINRACGIPGSFSWTGWAVLVASRPDGAAEEGVQWRSEGCGQCHIGGNYHPATEKMMPIGDVPDTAKDGIDCLICHAAEYDMNQRFVITDAIGRRWNQDRSLRAALSVGRPTNRNCLFCHQHNMGGDAYPHNDAARNLGQRHPRLLHHGAKRGNPFSPASDVHAAAGVQCIDCHVPEGHRIPRGQSGVDLVANDLPDKAVACTTCHTALPHNQSDHRALLNGHSERIACETCHIKQLEDANVVLRDWVHPTWNAETGIWEPTDVVRTGSPGQGIVYLWFNGNGTFLANALGDHPDGGDRYDPLMNQIARIDHPEVIAAVRARAEELQATWPDIDVAAYVQAATDPLSQLSPEQLAKRRRMLAENLRPIMRAGTSRIYPFKLFNALMYEDLGNQGPFGAMILPFDYAAYYEGGDPRAAVAAALAHPIVQRMYQTPFKYYMMDEFMAYFGVTGGWNTEFPLQDGGLGPQVQPRWMRQMGTLMVNHGIQRAGRTCQDCHAADGILDFAALGYAPERVRELQEMAIVEDLAGR
ncbi:MAG: nitrite reductase [Chromatiaceae bacterium]|nr:MAG: nitrite reductase [Chromatiaceae bacterium]